MSAKNRVAGHFNFRRAQREDIKAVREMIQELADFEVMSEGPKLTEDDLIRDAGLAGGTEYCHIYVLDWLAAEQGEQNSKTATIIGYAICFFSYSTWLGKSYFLEDIYVRRAYRGTGAGARLFCEVAAVARRHGCKRVDFHVLAWNPARDFYDKMGAIDLTVTEKWHFYRLQAEQIDRLSNDLPPAQLPCETARDTVA